MSLLFNVLSRLVITLLSRSKHLLISWLQSPSAVIYFAKKGPSSQSYGFSSSHVWIWELDYKESWVPKNWCFWTVVWRRLLRVLWTAWRSNQSVLKEISPEYSLEALMLKLKFHYFVATWCEELTHLKRPWYGKDRRQEEKGTTEDEMIRWHYRLNGHEFEQN